MKIHDENQNVGKGTRWGMWLVGVVAMAGVSCQSLDTRQHVVVSVAEQKMVLLERGELVRTYPVSTSKYGLGDKRGSYKTPVGKMVVAKKLGDGTPKGAVFKSRQWTGEVLQPDAPGRDPVLTRILWLKGREGRNRNAFGRLIYIHGTPEERNIGKPVSFGCVRMKSDDVFDLYGRVRVGTPVTVLPGRMPMAVQTAEMRLGMRKAWQATGKALAWNKKAPQEAVDRTKPEAAPEVEGATAGAGAGGRPTGGAKVEQTATTAGESSRSG